ncbi:MAG: hypothetical protein WBA89_12145 [Microcoleus sp.]|uniref:hypothetical protein n=1 Tax=Microcoleus sp. TaxID=44472 RepID=UPI003C73ACD0
MSRVAAEAEFSQFANWHSKKPDRPNIARALWAACGAKSARLPIVYGVSWRVSVEFLW